MCRYLFVTEYSFTEDEARKFLEGIRQQFYSDTRREFGWHLIDPTGQLLLF